MANEKKNKDVEPVTTGQVSDHIVGVNNMVTADAGATPAVQTAEPKTEPATQDTAQGAQAAATATETPKVSNATIQAENDAQRALGAAEKTINDSQDVKVLQGSVSEGNVADKVQAKKNGANAMGAEADARLDAETFRNGDAYRGVQTISARDNGFTEEYASRVIQDLESGAAPSVTEAEEPKQAAQPQETATETEKKKKTETEATSNVEQSKGKAKQDESEERKGRPVDTGVVDAKGRTAEQVIEQEGYERDKDGNKVGPKPVSFTPADNSTSQYDKDLADLEREYAKKVEEATRKKDEALERIMDDTSTISDKADAIERMAAADEVIKRYSSPGYAKRMHATKILAMLSDALSAIGNVLTATHGGVSMKVDSATEKVRKEEKANEAALQKRIDYWTKRMESARSSDAKASNFLRSRNMTSALEAYKASTRLAKDTFTSGVGALNSRYRRSGDALKAAKATVDAHNKRAYDYEKQRREQTFKHNENVYKEKQQNRRTDKNNATKIKTQKMRNKNKKEGFSLFS